jgi:hypothetical protein
MSASVLIFVLIGFFTLLVDKKILSRFLEHLNRCHFVKFQNPKLAFLDKMTHYQQILIKKNYQKAATRRFSRIFVQKKSTRRHLDFWPPFPIYKNNFTEWKNLYSLILAKFLKIKTQKSAILDCAAF